MADRLRVLGFDVILRTDSNLRDMTRSFSQFGQKLTPGSIALFYYAGHGLQVRGKNFLVPVDAEIDNEASVSSEAVDVDQLLNQLGPARLSMVILDACRNNPFERRFRGMGGGLAQIDAPTGTLLAYATAPGKVASDGNGSNGLYTDALLKALGTPGLKVEDVFKQVRISVVKSSDGQQTPWESSSLTGEFYFLPDSRPALADEKLKQSETARVELEKKLEDERKKRDKDAELVRAEMESLRAELQAIRAGSAKPAAPSVAATATTIPAAKPVTNAPSGKPVQVAIADPPRPPAPSPAAPAGNPAATVPTSVKPAQPPEQVALIAPPSGAQPASSEWKDRIATLHKFRGQLTLGKSLAILLDINSEKDVTQLLIFERWVKGLRWNNAYAMGVDNRGDLIWGGAYGEGRAHFATDTALKYCAQLPEDYCKVIVLNGDFQVRTLVEIAGRFGARSIADVRRAFLQSIEREPGAFATGLPIGAGPTTASSLPTMAYTSGRP